MYDMMMKLYDFVCVVGVKEKINVMFNGEVINFMENWVVLYVATRASKDKVINVDGKNVVSDVYDVLDKIKDFFECVCNGEWVGEMGKLLKDVVVIGIGGFFFGSFFVYTSLRTNSEVVDEARGC